MSARITSSVSSSARPVMLSCRECSADSSRSSISSFAGSKRTSCRHSSEPIDPPAPVTSTRLPCRNPAQASTSVSTGSRPSRSVTSMSRRSWRPTRPDRMFLRLGRTLTFRPSAAADSETSRNSSDRADGIAMIRISAPVRSAADFRAVRLPSTGIPSICRCRFSGSSSSRPTGMYGDSGLLSMLATSWMPAEPTPSTSAGAAPSGRTMDSCSERQTRRAASRQAERTQPAGDGDRQRQQPAPPTNSRLASWRIRNVATNVLATATASSREPTR